MPYASAEIPPAGAPAGFDFAAIIDFSVRSCWGWEVRICYRVRLRTRFVGGMRSDRTPCVSAEIPPAGAPAGFDFAAMIGFALAVTLLCRSAQNDTDSMAFCEM